MVPEFRIRELGRAREPVRRRVGEEVGREVVRPGRLIRACDREGEGLLVRTRVGWRTVRGVLARGVGRDGADLLIRGCDWGRDWGWERGRGWGRETLRGAERTDRGGVELRFPWFMRWALRPPARSANKVAVAKVVLFMVPPSTFGAATSI